MRRAIALLALSPFVSMAIAADRDPAVLQAESLLAKQQPNSAYLLLAPLEDEKGGDPDFDYVLGQAALNSGRASEAAFAFERCLAIDPKNGPCRVLMARAHMALGERATAKQELNTVQESQPPLEVSNLVAQYLGALQQQEKKERRNLNAWAQLGLGYDGNVNSARQDSSVVFPSLPGMVWTLNQAGVQQSDTFIQSGAGLSFSYKLSPTWRALADASVNTRGYQEWDAYSNLILDGGVGMGWSAGHNSLMFKLQQQAYYLDNNRYRNYTGALAQYQYAITETAGLSAYIQGSQLDYRGVRPDADRNTLGLGYSQALGGNQAPVIYAGLYGGGEKAEGNFPHLNQAFYGLRLGGSLGANRLRYTGSLSVEQRQFDGPQPLVMIEDREDTQLDVSLGLIHQVDRHFSIRPTYTFTTSSSNNPLSDFDRHMVSVDFRYDR